MADENNDLEYIENAKSPRLSSNFRPESMKSDFIGGRVSYRGIGVEYIQGLEQILNSILLNISLSYQTL